MTTKCGVPIAVQTLLEDNQPTGNRFLLAPQSAARSLIVRRALWISAAAAEA